MWLPFIFTYSFIFSCAPLVFGIGLYHWSKKKVGGWCRVPQKSNRGAVLQRGAYQGESLCMEIKSSTFFDQSNLLLSWAVFFLLHFSGVTMQGARTLLRKCLITFLHSANKRKNVPLRLQSLLVTLSNLVPWIKQPDWSGRHEAKLRVQLQQNCTE